MDINKLIDEARKASENAYVPYSNFKVGASLLLKNGTIFTGCNIENASYGLTNCAERTCLFKAYSEGVKKEDIVAFVVFSPKEHLVSPCGACRQVMSELLLNDIPVYMAYGSKYDYIETTVKDLLPYGFVKEDMENE